MAGTIGVLVAVAVLQLLQRDIVRIVVGLYLLWNAINVLFLALGAIRAERAPFADPSGAPMADPLVQAFVLTAIVITFGFTAFLVTLVFWLARREESLDVEDFRKEQD